MFIYIMSPFSIHRQLIYRNVNLIYISVDTPWACNNAGCQELMTLPGVQGPRKCRISRAHENTGFPGPMIVPGVQDP